MATFDIATELQGDRSIVVIRFIGQADTDSINRLLTAIAGLRAGDSLVRVLMDEGDLRPGLVLPQHIGGIVERWRQLIAGRRVRIAVFASNPLVFGLNRMAESLAAGDAEDRLAVFRDRDAAMAWLARD